MHGIKITNKTEQNLYPHVFYFDNGDFSIRKLISLLAYDVLQSNNLRMPIYNFFNSLSQTSNHYKLDSPITGDWLWRGRMVLRFFLSPRRSEYRPWIFLNLLIHVTE